MATVFPELRLAMTRWMWAALVGTLLIPANAQAQDEVVYYHTDAVGSVRMITDETGAVIHRYDYLPFGEPWDPPSNPDVRRFAGKERDETGLSYFGARYYRAQSGLFLSGDPGHVGADIFNPQSWNAYSYALNNPLRFVDPFGFASCPAPTDVSTCVEGRPGSGEFAFDWSRWMMEGWIRHELNTLWANFQDSLNGVPPPNGVHGGMPAPPFGRIAGRLVGATRFGPLAHGGPLPAAIAGTFRGGSYIEATVMQPTTLYRVYGGTASELGSFWTRTHPRGPLQSSMDLGLNPLWGNTATRVVTIRVPAGTRIFEGAAAPQGGMLGGGNQIYIPKVLPSWKVW